MDLCFFKILKHEGMLNMYTIYNKIEHYNKQYSYYTQSYSLYNLSIQENHDCSVRDLVSKTRDCFLSFGLLTFTPFLSSPCKIKWEKRKS